VIVCLAMRGPMPFKVRSHDRRVHGPLDRELLDPVQQRLTPFDVALGRLLLKEIIDVRISAVGVAPLDWMNVSTRLAALPEFPAAVMNRRATSFPARTRRTPRAPSSAT